MIIYKIVNNINGKIYVGQTINKLGYRISCHCRLNKSPIQQALNKYGLRSFTISIIDTAASRKILDEKECYWIKQLNCKAPNGYNLTDGGEGLKNVTEEIRKIIGFKIKGQKRTKEYRERQSRRMMGHAVSDKVRETARNLNKGKHLSDNAKKKMSEFYAKKRLLGEEKKCKKCGRIRERHLRQCPVCKKETKKIWEKNNPEKVKKYRRAISEKYREKIKENIQSHG